MGPTHRAAPNSDAALSLMRSSWPSRPNRTARSIWRLARTFDLAKNACGEGQRVDRDDPPSDRRGRTRPERLFRGGALRQNPAGAGEVAGVAVGMALEIILMLGLGLPERPGRRNLRHNLARP